jgi:hypothetical protein
VCLASLYSCGKFESIMGRRKCLFSVTTLPWISGKTAMRRIGHEGYYEYVEVRLQL